MKRDLIVTATTAIGVLFVCCGLPYGCMYAIAPVTYTWELDGAEGYFPSSNLNRLQHPEYSIDGINFTAWMRGDRDVIGSHSGPRHFRLSSYLPDYDEPRPTIRVLTVSVVSSKHGRLAIFEGEPFPITIELSNDNFQSWKGGWNSGEMINPDPTSGETITFTANLELIREGDRSTHILQFVFTPQRRHRPLTFWIPSV